MSNYLMQDVVQVQRFNTGIVIPVYFPAGVDPDTGATLLRDTAHSYAALVDDPKQRMFERRWSSARMGDSAQYSRGMRSTRRVFAGEQG